MTIPRSRELKFDPTFQPLPKDEGDEFYPNGIFEFNITKLTECIKANPKMFQPEEVAVEDARTYSQSNLNEATIQTANIAEPIILAEIAPGKFNVIDGNHRLERAYRDDMPSLFAYRLHPEQHVAFLTSIRAYQDYVEYWNSKLGGNP